LLLWSPFTPVALLPNRDARNRDAEVREAKMEVAQLESAGCTHGSLIHRGMTGGIHRGQAESVAVVRKQRRVEFAEDSIAHRNGAARDFSEVSALGRRNGEGVVGEVATCRCSLYYREIHRGAFSTLESLSQFETPSCNLPSQEVRRFHPATKVGTKL
jgi:hypothetical protein